MNEYGRWLASTLDQRWIRISAWVLALLILFGQWYQARYFGFADARAPDDPNRRRDGHSGHAQIDFGGQWLMGRMLVTGHGHELYSRPAYWTIAYSALPRERESPNAHHHDAELLVGSLMGNDSAERTAAVRVIVTGIIPALTPLSATIPQSHIHHHFDTATSDRLQRVERPADLGGPLYPPIHAFLMAPLTFGNDPQSGYFTWQWCLMGCAVLGAAAICYLSHGRIWWSAALLLILTFPGYRPALDLGQNSALTMMLILVGWALNVRGRPIAGGIVWGMLAYKPVWGLSFFIAALALRQWRFIGSMVITGLTLVALTIPFVGVQSWRDWLHVGGSAASLYDVDANWVFLSRDLFGIPRRIMLDFDQTLAARETLGAQVAAWAMWFLVIEVTICTWLFSGRRSIAPTTGALPAFLFLAAWLCCYHFMYYDSLMAVVGVSVLLAGRGTSMLNPARAVVEIPGPKHEPTLLVLFNSMTLTLIAGLIVYEAIISNLDIQATFGGKVYGHDLSNGYLSTNVRYPWDTLLILMLWIWCGWLALREAESSD